MCDVAPALLVIVFLADTILSSRYHCCTAVGVHSVALPWLHKIDGFIKADDENDEILTEITSVSGIMPSENVSPIVRVFFPFLMM